MKSSVAKRRVISAKQQKKTSASSPRPKMDAEAAVREIAIGRGHVYSYQIVLRPEPEGGYTIFVPSLPGCITYGRSLEEAYTMAEDAIRAYLLSREKHEDTDPASDKQSLISFIDVPLYR